MAMRDVRKSPPAVAGRGEGDRQCPGPLPGGQLQLEAGGMATP